MRRVPIACAAAAVVWRLPYLLEPLGRDQGIFAAAAAGLLAGRAPYTGVWDHKPPLGLVAYALAVLVDPGGPIGVHLVDLAAAAIGAALMAAIAGRAAGRAAAVAAGVAYAVHANFFAFGAFWSRAQPEMLADLPAIGAFALAAGLVAPVWPARRRLALAGALVGVAAQVKLPAVTLALVPAAAAWLDGRSLRERSVNAAAALGGFAAVQAAVAAALAAWGALPAAWDAVVLFNLAHRAGAVVPVAHVWQWPLLLAPPYARAAVLAPLAIGAAGFVAWRGRTAALGALWLVAAYAEVLVQGRFWSYHYVPIIAPLALGCGCAAAAVAQRARARWAALEQRPGIASTAANHRGPSASLALAVRPQRTEEGASGPSSRRLAAEPRSLASFRGQYLVVALAAAAALEVPFTLSVARYYRSAGLGALAAGAIDARTYRNRLRRRDFDPQAVDDVAAWLRGAAPGASVLVLGFDAGIYYFSGRRPASRFLFDYPLYVEDGPRTARRRAALLADLDADPPDRVAVGTNDVTDLEDRPSIEQLLDFPELRARLRREYRTAGRLGGYLLLERATAPRE